MRRLISQIGQVGKQKSVMIPLVLIALLGSLLAGQTAIRSWTDWSFQRQAPLTELIPDNADVIVTINLRRVGRRDAANALNRWRTKVTQADAAAMDWPAIFREWTGWSIDDGELADWAGRRAAIFSSPDGQAVMIETRDPEKLDQWLTTTRASDGQTQWMTRATSDRITMASSSEMMDTIEQTAATGARTSASSTSDLRRAHQAHTLSSPAIEIFARWRATGDQLPERLAGPLDCNTRQWVSARIAWDDETLRAEIVCPSPTRTWTTTPLDTTAVITGASDITLSTTFRTNWPNIDERV